MSHWFRHRNKSRTSSKQINEIVRNVLFVLITMFLPLLTIFGVFVLIRPHIHTIIMAIVLVIVFFPIYRWLQKQCKERKNLAAFLAVLLVSLLVIIPICVLGSILIKEGQHTLQSTKRWLTNDNTEEYVAESTTTLLNKYPITVISPNMGMGSNLVMQECNNCLRKHEWLEKDLDKHILMLKIKRLTEHPKVVAIQKFLEEHFNIKLSPSEAIKKMGSLIVKFGGDIAISAMKTTGSLVVSFFIMLFIMFYTFRDGQKYVHYFLHLFPLKASQRNALLHKIKEVSRAVFSGVLLTSISQSLVAMFGFWLAGIPPLLWGVILGFFSIIPVVGTAVVWVPASIYLFLIGKTWWAIFLISWCVIVVNSVDNFVRPLIVGERLGMPYIIIFFALVGGLQAFGLMGLIYGPLIFGLCAVCLYIYERENSDFLNRQDQL